jgi:cellulose synthase/poly-beta-1,6-N-acetylglucosamine synthase-like glycosyltransferase
MTRAVFWASAAVVVYVYFGYPLLLLAWSRLRPKPVHAHPDEPPVSVIIAVRDEAEALERKIANLRSLDYPASHLQIVVVSDGNNRQTAAVLRRNGGVIDALYVPRGGKAQALNAGVEAARHDILVFADVRQRFDRQALRGLVAPLADPTVGGVSGELMLDVEVGGGRRRSSDNRPPPAHSTDIGEGMGGYWRYEKWLRRQESAIGSTMGATGAIYALRRALWKPLPADTILDDVLAPMRAVLAASRVVFSSEALAFDPVAPSGVELRRKIRTLAGNYQILRLEPRLLNPFRNPVWIQYMSHKVGRLLVPYALIALLATSGALAAASPFYALAFAAQILFYGLAGYGAWLSRRDRRLAEDATRDEPAVNALIKGTTTS